MEKGLLLFKQAIHNLEVILSLLGHYCEGHFGSFRGFVLTMEINIAGNFVFSACSISAEIGVSLDFH